MDEDHDATITFDISTSAMHAVSPTPEGFAGAMRLAAAMFWYGRGEVSQEQCAAIAGLDRTDFLLALGDAKQDFAVVDFDDLDQELARVRAERSRKVAQGG